MQIRNSVVAIALLVSAGVLAGEIAQAQDNCFSRVERRLKREARRSSDWGFESLQVITKDEAIGEIRNALEDMTTDQEKARAIAIARQSNRLFYGLTWTAPSNSGYSVLIVDSRTCRQLVSVGITSEE